MNNVLSLIKSIQEFSDGENKKPCKKVVQKLAYLIQQKNIDLELDYTIHFYGPYSEDLDLEIRQLNSQGSLNIDFSNSKGHLITVAEQFFSKIELLSESAQSIIKTFGARKPSELELIATTLYVQRELGQASKDEISKAVIRIKGSKYPQSQINSTIDELSKNAYFSIT